LGVQFAPCGGASKEKWWAPKEVVVVAALRSRNPPPSSHSIRMPEWTMSEIQVSGLRHLHSTSVNLLAME